MYKDEVYFFKLLIFVLKFNMIYFGCVLVQYSVEFKLNFGFIFSLPLYRKYIKILFYAAIPCDAYINCYSTNFLVDENFISNISTNT